MSVQAIGDRQRNNNKQVIRQETKKNIDSLVKTTKSRDDSGSPFSYMKAQLSTQLFPFSIQVIRCISFLLKRPLNLINANMHPEQTLCISSLAKESVLRADFKKNKENRKSNCKLLSKRASVS